ncbi:unnamed protein product, partial [Laminaria digitata]
MSRAENIQDLTKRLILMTGLSLLITVVIFGINFAFGERLMLSWLGF